MRSVPNSLPFAEFVILLAFMVSIVAMSTDIILPGLADIGRDLKVADINHTQLVVTTLFAGFAVGQLLVGPLSDSYGRKPVIYGSYVVFILGCAMSLSAQNMTVMLVGRLLQGVGAAGPRVVSQSLIRDCYEGRAMARIMSVIMSVFILVPALAPSIGQAIITLGGWRATFTFLLIQAVVSFIWFALRQPETLPVSARRIFSLSNITGGIIEALSNKTVLGYTLAAGLIFGAFLGYLSTARQIFQQAYHTGASFPLYFAIAALAIGSASFFNSLLVMRLGMRSLILSAIITCAIAATAFLIPTYMMNGLPPFHLFMFWLLITFFCMGLLFGNLNAIAMEPLGHMAGLGAAIIGSVSTLMSLPLGWFIGYCFNGGITSLVAGFAALATASLFVVVLTEKTGTNNDSTSQLENT